VESSGQEVESRPWQSHENPLSKKCSQLAESKKWKHKGKLRKKRGGFDKKWDLWSLLPRSTGGWENNEKSRGKGFMSPSRLGTVGWSGIQLKGNKTIQAKLPRFRLETPVSLFLVSMRNGFVQKKTNDEEIVSLTFKKKIQLKWVLQNQGWQMEK